jgi:hypothetical protein
MHSKYDYDHARALKILALSVPVGLLLGAVIGALIGLYYGYFR